MNNIFYRAFIIITFILSTQYLSALNISVTNSFFQYEKTKYLEVYIQVIGSTTKFVKVDSNNMQANVNFLIALKKDGKIINYDKFKLDSPLFSEPKDFIGLRRFKIDTGGYTLEVTAIDANNPENKYTFKDKINIDLLDSQLCISSIELLTKVKKDTNNANPLVKNGYYMEPALFNFYPKMLDSLFLYFEIYNLDKSPHAKKLMISINRGFFEESTGKKTLLERKMRLRPMKLKPVLTNMDIRGLSSGNYHIIVDIEDADGNVLYSRYKNFQRSNPVKNEYSINTQNIKNSFAYTMPADSVFYSLKAMVPVMKASESEAINNIITEKNLKRGRFFLWRYWNEYNKYDPAFAYHQYMKYAKAVDIQFRSQVGYGFETDRGYIYLKYGRPTDVITVENEPTAPPYEIWVYDVIEETKQKNVKFIFYIPSLATNDYVLLHSTCQGERQNPAWFYYLYSKRTDSNIQGMKTNEIKEFFDKLKNSFGNNAVKIWEDL